MKAPLPTERMVQRGSDVPADTLARLLRYDPTTGALHWKARTTDLFPHSLMPEAQCKTFNKQFAGKEALTAASKGYRVGRLFNRMVQAHRVAFALHHGRWPTGQVDHIDGNPLNNTASNLREVTNAENHKNERRPKSNTSGIAGVGRHGSRWRAHIKVNYRQMHLGLFDTRGEAAAARKAAEFKLGFHVNHGRVA